MSVYDAQMDSMLGRAVSTATRPPERIQLRRTKDWRKPEGAIVVARPSKWGNPFPVEEFGRERSVAMYRNLILGIWNPRLLDDLDDPALARAYVANEKWRRRIGGHPLEAARFELAAHDLACWCPLDQPCHADVLLELAKAPQ
jgi:hypothetical protein